MEEDSRKGDHHPPLTKTPHFLEAELNTPFPLIPAMGSMRPECKTLMYHLNNNTCRLCVPASCFATEETQKPSVNTHVDLQLCAATVFSHQALGQSDSSEQEFLHSDLLPPSRISFSFFSPTVESLFYFLLCPRCHLVVLGGRTDAARCPQRSEVGVGEDETVAGMNKPTCGPGTEEGGRRDGGGGVKARRETGNEDEAE